MEKQNTPKLRFSSFTDPWEQRKVSELFKITRGYVLAAPLTSETKTEEMPYPVYSSQTKDKGLMGYYKDYLYEDAITWTTDGANAGTVNYRAGKFYCTNVCGVLLQDKAKPNQMIAEALNNVAKSHVSYVGNPKLMNNVMAEIDISLPSDEAEREQISSYFSSIDNLITLHQQKCNQVKILKKVMLQKMFPKEGETVPEIRFPGFTDPWEQCKLSALCENITVGIANSATHAYRENGVIMFRNQNIKENHLDDSDIIHIDEEFEKKYINKRLKANDLLIARTGYPGTACVVPEKYEGSQTFTTLIARLKDGINPFYACQYINSDYGKKYILTTQIGGGQKNSGAGILEDLPMMLPPTIKEQNKIAEFLTSLDDTITLHQCKCDELKELKKGLLQQMFV